MVAHEVDFFNGLIQGAALIRQTVPDAGDGEPGVGDVLSDLRQIRSAEQDLILREPARGYRRGPQSG